MPRTRPVTVRIRGKVTDKWREAVKHGGKVLVFSPYVTNPTAWDVLSVGASRCELYTVLDPMNFATGGSSLDALKKLAAGGVKLFSLEPLHAKLMIVPGRLLSVGSQNLTRLGTSPKRLEASAVVTDPKLIEKAEKDVAGWIAAAQPVTPEMLDELTVSVRKLKKKVKKLKREAAGTLETVITNQRERDKKKNTPPEEPKPPKPHERRDLIAAALRKLRETAMPIRCKVHDDRYGLLTPMYGRKFSELWEDKGDRLDRFVCFDARSMRWGWARIGKGRIGRIHQGLTQSGKKAYQDRLLTFDLKALAVNSPEEPNLAITINYMKESVCNVTGMLLLDGMVIDKVEPTKNPWARQFDFSKLRGEITRNQDGLRDSLLDLIAEPFEYIAGQKLRGKSPKSFFGPGYYRAYVSEIGGNPTLVVTEW